MSGGRYVLEREVGPGDTAAAFGAEFPAAAATPFVLGLAEVACHRAAADEFADGQVTVGTRASVEHLLPSPVGARLEVRAALAARDGRFLRFAVEVYDGESLAARITHTRAVVERARIEERLESR